MSMKRAAHRNSTHRRLALELLACAFRMLILLLALQLSGTAAVAVEAGFAVLDRVDCCNECPLESSGKECPPGCPNCHCVHGQIALLPASPPELELRLRSGAEAMPEPLEASAPHSPFLPSLYRPPRAVQS
jgi:hypothetical protein